MRESLRSQIAHVWPMWQSASLAEMQNMAVTIDQSNMALKAYAKPGKKADTHDNVPDKIVQKSASQKPHGQQHSGKQKPNSEMLRRVTLALRVKAMLALAMAPAKAMAMVAARWARAARTSVSPRQSGPGCPSWTPASMVHCLTTKRLL